MYCKHCGKELPEGAAICPGCGTPIARPVQPKKKPVAEKSAPVPVGDLKGKTGAIIGFTCSLIALICCIVFISYTAACGHASFVIFSYSFYYPTLPLLFGNAMGLLVIATALIGLLAGIYGSIHAAGVKKYRVLSITAIVFSAITLLLFFLLYCVFYISFSFYPYY